MQARSQHRGKMRQQRIVKTARRKEETAESRDKTVERREKQRNEFYVTARQ